MSYPGRPTKLNEATVARICEALEKGLPMKLAAQAAGISFETFRQWRQGNSAFSVSVERALAQGAEKRLEIVLAAASKGDVKAAQWWLCNCFPQYFGQERPRKELSDELE